MAGLHKSDIPNPVLNWIDLRLPIITMMQKEYGVFPDAAELQLLLEFRRDRDGHADLDDRDRHLPGDELPAEHQPGVRQRAAHHARRELWLAIRYVHQNGASMFFIVTYIHIFRGLYYGSYKAPRELLWILGVVILLLMMATAFMGYVLPWGQMSYWGATVITNLFSAFPGVGKYIVTLLWGGFSVDQPTLNRFSRCITCCRSC